MAAAGHQHVRAFSLLAILKRNAEGEFVGDRGNDRPKVKKKALVKRRDHRLDADNEGGDSLAVERGFVQKATTFPRAHELVFRTELVQKRIRELTRYIVSEVLFLCPFFPTLASYSLPERTQPYHCKQQHWCSRLEALWSP